MRGSSQYDGQGGPDRASDNCGCLFRGHELGVSDSNPRCAIAAVARSPVFSEWPDSSVAASLADPGGHRGGITRVTPTLRTPDAPATRPPHPGNHFGLPGVAA